MEKLFDQLQEIHVAAWNEKDEKKREELLKKVYADDIRCMIRRLSLMA